MALTLVEAAKLATDQMRRGVIEEIATPDSILSLLPFIGVNGNALAYNRLNAPPSVDFYAVGDTWTEATPTFTAVTTAMKILGGDSDVDNFLQASRTNQNDLGAEVLLSRARATKRAIEDKIVNGDIAVDPNEFDGLDELCVAGQTLTMGIDGASLTLAALDELVDKTRPGKPDVLMMSRRTRRGINDLARAAGTLLGGMNELGQFSFSYDGIPIVINDYISDAQTVGINSDNSTIFALRLDSAEGLVAAGVQDGADESSIIRIDNIGVLETKDASRVRVKAYMALILYNTLSIARLVGVRP